MQKEECLSVGAQPEILLGKKGGMGRGEGSGRFVELGHFDKDFVKSPDKRGSSRKYFADFSPKYS